MWNFLWLDKKKVTFQYRWLLNRGDRMGRLTVIRFIFYLLNQWEINEYWLYKYTFSNKKKCDQSTKYKNYTLINWSQLLLEIFTDLVKKKYNTNC